MAHDTRQQGSLRELTPTGRIKTHAGKSVGMGLADAVLLTPWPTPTTRDGKDGDCDLSVTEHNGLLGRVVLLASNSPTGQRGALNPRFSLWLQGYPETWALSGARAMRSTRG